MEKKLLKKCIAGSRKGQKALFDKYYTYMYHVAMRYLSDHHNTEDVLSGAFMRVFKNIGRFEYRGDGSLEKWIKTIVINESIRFLNRNESLRFESDLSVYENINLQENEPDHIDPEAILRLIEIMPAGYRTVFNLFAIEGLSHQEIAQTLQISVSTSKSQLFKARNFLVEKLLKKKDYGIA